MKLCWKCGKMKAFEEFNRSKTTRNGLSKICKTCHNERARGYRAAKGVPARPRAITPSYAAIHFRLVKARGKAEDYKCVNCDRPAQQWSYDHTDENELVSDKGYVYSADLERYEPRCASCHHVYDTA